MKPSLLFSLLAVFVISWCVTNSTNSSPSEVPVAPTQSSFLLPTQVCLSGQCFRVEIADNDESRHRGLMYRQFLAPDTWMLFVFEESGIYPFRMKNTLIPLDMIRINEEKKVIHVDTATPCLTQECKLYSPSEESRYVLEVNAWTAKKYAITTWTIVTIQ